MGGPGAALAKAATLLERAAGTLSAAKGWKRWAAAFLAGVAGALALAPVYALPLLAVGFSTLVLLIDGAGRAPRPARAAFVAGWFFGFGYFLAGVYWMSFSFFVQADEFAWMAPFVVFGVPAFLGLFPAGAALVARALWRAGWARIFLFAAVWAFFEYVRGHILTGLPWNLAGQALAGTAPGAQTAAWYGAYGLSLAATFLAAAPAAHLGQSAPAAKALSGLGVMALGLAAMFAVGAARLALPEPAPDGRHFVRIVQPSIAQRDKIDPDKWAENFRRLLDLSTGPFPEDARLFVIWPENAAPLLDEAETALAVLSAELPANAILIAGAVRREQNDVGPDRYFNSVMVFEQARDGRKVATAYDKHHLVPFGEFLPLYDVLNAVGLAQLTPYGDAGFAAGAGPRTLRAGGPAFAPLICYEAIFPGALYPQGARPDWLLAVTNDAWFGDTSGPRQHFDQARLRTIETGLPMARAANTGVSAVIDAKGRVLARIALYQRGRIEAALPRSLAPTLYARVGDGIYLLMSLTFLGFGRWRARL